MHGKLYLLKQAVLETICRVFKMQDSEQVEGIAANAAHARPWISEGVGVVPINGVLFNDEPFFFFGGLSYGAIRETLDKFENDSTVQSIVLDINSPGGDAFGVAELAEYVRSIEKPVHAYVSGEAASGAYWLASAADHITAHKTSFVGSIGTRVAFFKPNEDFEVIIVSEQSPLKVPDLDSEEGLAQIREHLNTLSDHFIADVAAFRATDVKTVQSSFGQGDIVNAENALQVGMVDAIGNFQDALAVARNADQLIVGQQETNEAGEENTTPTALALSTQAQRRFAIMAKRNTKRIKVKSEFVIVDGDAIEGDLETVEVTRQTIEDMFPDIAEELKEAGRDEIQEEMQDVSEAAALADNDDEDEAKAVRAAYAGKISAKDLPMKLLEIRSKRQASAPSTSIEQGKPEDPRAGNGGALQEMLDRRGEDQPAVAAAGGGLGATPPKESKTQVAVNHLRKLRGGKQKRG